MTTAEKKKKVVVVEDEEALGRVYLIKLKQAGIEAVLAVNGEEGLDKIKSEKPDLVLLDLMLPVHDGFWLLEEKRKIKDIRDIPVIVLSNLGQEQDKKRAEDLGVKDYLVKAEMSFKSITEKVKKFL